MTDVWLGLISGVFFGFVIQRVGATNPDKMALGHLMVEPHIPAFMLLAVAFSALGLFGLQAAGVGRTSILPLSLGATTLAGVLFGLGWGLTGYCPGTSWAAAGEGRMDALFTLLGGLCGTAAFAHLHEWLVPLLYDPTNMGKLTLDGWLGTAEAALMVELAVLFLGVWFIWRWWNREPPV